MSIRREDVNTHEEEAHETVRAEATNGHDKQETYTRQHRQRERYPIRLPARHFYVKCEDGEQVYEITEGMQPHCPECGNMMRVLSEVKQ